MTETLFLTSEETRGLATIKEYVEAVRDGYREVGTDASAAPRQKLVNGDPPGILTSYLSILPETGAMGGYTYAAGFGDADAHFFLPLFDAESGAPLALIDGAAMNPYKTGAVGGVAADALARPDAETAAIIGTGAQAKGQLRALTTVRDLSTVNVYSPTTDHRESFAATMNEELAAAVGAVASSDAAVEGADVVVTATDAREPVFDGDVLDDGTHVTAMGQYDESAHELDTETVARAKYVPDLHDRALSDSGEFLTAREEGAVDEEHIHAELGEILTGEAPGREDREEITVFDSGGTGVETVAAAHMLYEKAKDAGLGQTIDLAPASEALR
ncbi:ornithine cyclodeaminase [Halobacteriales archaeon QS_9_67_17]|nr:MAG: ornithine cyclodeaminase [Halobacteriales archaeon QS_9_67_17]